MSKDRIVGAVIAGGKSRRFGTDKAAFLVDGKPMLDHVIAALRPQVDDLVLCGKDWNGIKRIEDRPKPNMGPLGGLNAALAYASENGFDAVVTVPVDVLPLPNNFIARLKENPPSVFEEQYLIGYWPSSCAAQLDEYLASTSDVAVHSWLDHIHAHRVKEPLRLFNMNTQADLERYRKS